MKRRINLKNITIIVLIYTASLFFINISLASSTGKITVETANLRQSASSDSKILELISINENVEVIEKQGEWYKIKYKGITGFLRQDLITVQQEEQEDTQKPEEYNQQEQINKDTISVNSNATNIEGSCKILQDTALKILPLISSSDINILKKDIKVNVIEIINNWACIETDNSKGWVICKNLEKIDETQEKVNKDNNEQEKKEENKTRIAYIKTESVNLRKEANTNCEVIQSLKQNTEVTVVSENNNWCKVEVNGKEGYISASLLSDKKQETSRSTEQSRKVEDKGTDTQTKQSNNIETNNTSNNQSMTTANNSDVISYAKQYLGCKYVYGGTTPKGFDCSGFTQYVYKNFGISLNRTAAAQYSNGKAVTNLQSGDLVMFGKSGINHVGIYIGGGTFIHAANPSRGVTTDTLLSGYYKTNYVGARRVK